jgi:hypothetical protein
VSVIITNWHIDKEGYRNLDQGRENRQESYEARDGQDSEAAPGEGGSAALSSLRAVRSSELNVGGSIAIGKIATACRGVKTINCSRILLLDDGIGCLGTTTA